MGWFSFFGNQPKLTAQASLDRVVVHVTFREPEDIAKDYPGKLGVTRGPMLLEDGEQHAYIEAPRPEDFNDTARLETLGHEFFHALGARHE